MALYALLLTNIIKKSQCKTLAGLVAELYETQNVRRQEERERAVIALQNDLTY